MMSTEDERVRAERPEEIVDEIVASLDDLQGDLSEGAAIVGQEKERYVAIRPVWERLANTSIDDPDVAEVYLRGMGTLAAFRDELSEQKEQMGSIRVWVRTAVSSSDYGASATSTTASMFSEVEQIDVPEGLTLPRYGRYDETTEKLAELDPALADTHRAIREVLYGTRSDAERGALYLIRQMFDHFFGILAPDEDVRSSAYWTEKSGDGRNQVTRRERITYAAHTHICSPAKRRSLLASTDHMLQAYRALNKAHKRGALNAESAREALREMWVLIDGWVQAMNL